MDEKIEIMLEANKLTHKILDNCVKLIKNSDKPIATSEVSKYVRFLLTRASVKSAFRGLYGFPDVMCISVNDAIIHGVPSEDVIIKEGDVVSLDFGIIMEGYCSDAAITFLNQKKVLPGNKKNKLIKDTKKALDNAVMALDSNFPRCRIYDITKMIDMFQNKYGIVDNFGGHEIGKNVHESSLFIPNTINTLKHDTELKVGQVITIEPMFTLGSPDNYVSEDGFTIKTKDKSISAHFEYSIAITENGILVLK